MPSKSFIDAMERHRRDEVCREAATIAMQYIREHIQTAMSEEGWEKHLYVLRIHLIKQMGNWPP